MKRILIYLIGLNLLAIGIVVNISSGLGVAALSSSIYATSEIFNLTLGTASIIWYLLFVVIQCVLLKKITLEFLMEIPLSLSFGLLTDLYASFIVLKPKSILQSLILLGVAIICISLGVYLTTKTNIVLNPGDGIVKTISQISQKQFSFIKNIFDISMITCSIMLSILTNSQFYGIGVGTIISALMIGRTIKLWERMFNKNYIFETIVK